MSFSIPIHNASFPFFTGEFADPRTIPYTVSLDGHDYSMNLEEYRHNGVARFRNGVVTSNEVNDGLLNPEGAWWRYRHSWHSGAGQEIDELDPDSIASRFEASRGIDVWDKYKACLLNDTSNKLTVAAAAVHMVSTATYVYVSDGTGVKRSADLTTWVAITGLTGTVQGMATDGTTAYIATTTDVYKVATAGVGATLVSTAGTADYSTIAFVSNRLIVASDNVIGELTTTTFDAIYTHFQPAFRWTVIFGVGSRIYMGGYAGNRSELYTTTTTDAGAIALSAEAASFFSGELIESALSYGGAVILGTSEGIRFAQLGADATLTYGPLINDFGGAGAMAAQGRFVYVAVENFPGTGSGVVRLALDEFTAPLLPAYASDVFTEAVTDEVMAVARFDDKTLFAVTADAVYASNDTTYVTSGYIDSGDITFGTVEDKSVSQLRANFVALAANESITILATDETNATMGTKTASIDGQTTTTLDLAGDETNRTRVRFTLAGDGTTTPCLEQWRLRGYPIAPGVEEWLVPLIIHSRTVVNDSEGQVLAMDPWTETARIRDNWQTQNIVLYKEGDYAFRVRIDNFQIGAVEWRDGSDYFEINCTVRLLST
jgi:hypothetical protein